MSVAGPSCRVTTWRRSMCTSSPTGGTRQSGIITWIESGVGPATTIGVGRCVHHLPPVGPDNLVSSRG